MINKSPLIMLLSTSFLLMSVSYATSEAYIKSSCQKGRVYEQCAANGGVEYIYIYDEIDQDTARKVIDTAGLIPVNKPFPKVYLNSRGGSSIHAKEIGRTLRLRNAEVESRDVFFPEREPLCASACVEIAAGAIKRNLYSIEVHRGSWVTRVKGDNFKYDVMSDEDMRETYEYFREMGISEDLINIIKFTNYNELIRIPYHPELSFQYQKLAHLGFRMREPSEEELDKMRTFHGDVDIYAAETNIKLALSGDKDAALILGRRYLLGLDGEQKDVKKGLMWLSKAADLGNPSACHLLGVTYRDATPEIKQDLKLAFSYFLRGAKLGFSGSQNNVGWAYYKGNGTDKNLYEAVYWITKAAEQGEPFGYGSLAEIRFHENIFIPDDVETLKFYILATRSLPKGSALDDDKKDMAILKKRMTRDQQELAARLANEWHPIKDYGLTMRDKNDR
jgi:TPR repeat protein